MAIASGKAQAMRTVVISGASSGIGEATARRFAKAGDHVVNLDVQPPLAGGDAPGEWMKVDVACWSDVQQALEQVHADRGRVDVVVANAGISVRHGVLDITEADARRVCEVNLLGVLGLWTCAARIMVEHGGGVLLATASVNGTRGYPRYADYNATKAGVASLCQTFAMELSPLVRTACVSPGAVLTPMQEAEYTEEMFAEVNARIPAGRHAAPSEIAEAFFYLASPGAAFVTGAQLLVDGGESLGATTTDFGTGGR